MQIGKVITGHKALAEAGQAFAAYAQTIVGGAGGKTFISEDAPGEVTLKFTTDFSGQERLLEEMKTALTSGSPIQAAVGGKPAADSVLKKLVKEVDIVSSDGSVGNLTVKMDARHPQQVSDAMMELLTARHIKLARDAVAEQMQQLVSKSEAIIGVERTTQGPLNDFVSHTQPDQAATEWLSRTSASRRSGVGAGHGAA